MLNMGLGFVFSAQDMASGAIKNLERNFMSLDKKVGIGAERIQSGFAQVTMGMGILGAGAAMVGGAFALANVAGEFETAVAAVAAVSGATAGELEQLKNAAIEAGIATQYSPTEAVVGLKELSQAGYSAQESMKLLIPVLDLAAGSLGELTPASAAGLASQTLKAFGISADESAGAVDKMLQAVNVFALGAGELPMALGIASRGAQTMNQSLGETLIGLGLVKNIIPGVERASTGLAVAMEKMVNPETQKAIKGLGVDVVDSSGKFRPFLDVIGDMVPALQEMSDAKRGAYLLDTFGAHSLGAVQAIMTQVTNGIRTNTGVTVKGAEAVKYLRNQFDNAGGTAANFRDKMLDTFEGQKKLLKGSMETLAIVMGQPFAAVFKPIVGAVIKAVNGFLAVFKALPMPVRKAFAAFVVGAGAVLMAVGSFIAMKGSIVLAQVALKALGFTFGGLVSALAPVIGVLALVAVLVAGLYVAFQKNLGGMRDFVTNAVGGVKLAFDGLVQLFSDGGFSGSVRTDLNKAENSGLKNFLVTVVVWVERIKNLFRNIGDGFEKGLALIEPTINTFRESLSMLGDTISKAFGGKNDPMQNLISWQTFGEIGAGIGKALAVVFGVLIYVIGIVMDVLYGMAKGWDYVKAGVDILWGALVQLGDQLGSAISRMLGLNSTTEGSGHAWQMLGEVISWVVGVIAGVLGVAVSIISAALSVISAAIEIVKGLFLGLADTFSGVFITLDGLFTDDWKMMWDGMKLVAFGMVNFIIKIVTEMVGAIAGIIDSVSGVFGASTHLQDGVRAIHDKMSNGLAVTMGVDGYSQSASAAPKTENPYATAPATNQSTAPAAAIAALPPQTSSQPVVVQAPPAPPAPPQVINLNVDGQKLASVVNNSNKDSAGRAFSTVPAY